MEHNDLPETISLQLMVYNVIMGDEERTPVQPYSRTALLADAQVKEWIAKGYELEGFENRTLPNDPYNLLVIVNLRRL